MSEIQLLKNFRDEVPMRQPPPGAERALMAAILDDGITSAPAGRMATGGLVRPGRLAVAGGLGLALAASLLLVQVVSSGGISPAPSASAADLARHAAAAVSHERTYPLGQWFYEQQHFRGPAGWCLPRHLAGSEILPISVSSGPYPAPSSSGPYPAPSSSGPYPAPSSSGPYPAPSGSASHRSPTALRAVSLRPYVSRSKQSKSCASGTPSSGTITYWSRDDPVLRSYVDEVWLGGGQQGAMRYAWAGRPITRADLSRLPIRPSALISYLSGLSPTAYILSLVTGPHSGSTIGLNTFPRDDPGKRAFAAIGQILGTYYVKPARLAEFYRALGMLPGVTVNTHAIDIIGRHGVAFTMSLPEGIRLQIVLNSRSYRFMGYSVEYLSEPVAWGNAVIKLVPVAAPGNRP
jgi:hypothetical protein